MLKFDISDNEIGTIENLAPMLEVTSFDEFLDACKVLVEFGYPKEDLDYLILTNPNIFVLSRESLEKDLTELKAKYGDIEEALKNDPYAI